MTLVRGDKPAGTETVNRENYFRSRVTKTINFYVPNSWLANVYSTNQGK